MTYLIPLGLIVVLFVAMPWLAVAFSHYCDAVNRFLGRRKRKPGTPHQPGSKKQP